MTSSIRHFRPELSLLSSVSEVEHAPLSSERDELKVLGAEEITSWLATWFDLLECLGIFNEAIECYFRFSENRRSIIILQTPGLSKECVFVTTTILDL